jgi:hypothetical protein
VCHLGEEKRAKFNVERERNSSCLITLTHSSILPTCKQTNKQTKLQLSSDRGLGGLLRGWDADIYPSWERIDALVMAFLDLYDCYFQQLCRYFVTQSI